MIIGIRLSRIAVFVGLGVAWLLAASAALAQSPADCPPAARAPTSDEVRTGLAAARDHGFLWRIRKDGRDAYLFGTLHVARLEWLYPGPRVLSAMNASDTVALELDVLDPDIQRRLAQGMAAKPGGTELPDALQARIRRQARSECLPPESLAALSPELQMATLLTLVGRRDGLDPAYGVDIFLAGWARTAKKAVVSLETPELQMQALLASTPEEAIEFVQGALDDLDSGRARPLVRRLAQVWADGELSQLASYTQWCDCITTDADRKAMTRLVDERNPALADSIAALHAAGRRVFAAVGSLHMAGPLGLPALLAQRGFSVERIPAAP